MLELPADPGLYDTLRNIPRVARAVFDNARLAMVKYRNRPAGRVVLNASGEAIAAADLAAAVLSGIATQPVVTHHGKDLPAWLGDDDVVIVASLTGDAADGVSAVAAASELGCGIGVVTAGGHLWDMADSQRYALADLAAVDYQGASAFAALFFSLLGAAAAVALPNGGRSFAADVESNVTLLERLRDAYGPSVASAGNPARLVAGVLQGAEPVLFGTSGIARETLPVVSRRMRQIGGSICHTGLLSERGDDTAPLEQGDMAIVFRAAGSTGDPLSLLAGHWPPDSLHEIELAGANALEQAWSAITLFDWAAFYLAP
jgi:hypothetical protein